MRRKMTKEQVAASRARFFAQMDAAWKRYMATIKG